MDNKHNQGIYIILCTASKKVYVGSSNNCRNRWSRHKGDLRKRVHFSNHLQKAWDKYGEESFEFLMVEEVIDKNLLISREQFWIDKTKSYKGKFGYNGRQQADVCSWIRESRSKEYILRFQDKSEIKIKNLSQYCLDNNLNQGALSAVARHRTNHHKNIHCRFASETYDKWLRNRNKKIEESKNTPKKKPAPYTTSWKVIHPDGKIEIVKSLTAFCENHNLSQGNMAEVARGHRKQHKGFKCEFLTNVKNQSPAKLN